MDIRFTIIIIYIITLNSHKKNYIRDVVGNETQMV